MPTVQLDGHAAPMIIYSGARRRGDDARLAAASERRRRDGRGSPRSILQQHRANRAAEGFRDADGEIKPLEVATAPELSGLGVGALVRRLFAQQEERVRVYRRREQGFAQFLEVAEAEGYDALVADATAAFAQVSAGVNAVEAAPLARGADVRRLRGAGAPAAGARAREAHRPRRSRSCATALAVDKLRDEAGDDVGEPARRMAGMRREEAAEARGDARAADRAHQRRDRARCAASMPSSMIMAGPTSDRH